MKQVTKTKRIKKVFSSSAEVLHLWANQSQSDARQAGTGGGMHSYRNSFYSRCYFEGTSCYSYGSHYELGRLVKYKGLVVALVNNSGYSNITSKHINEAWGAVSHMPRIEVKSIPYTVNKTELRKALVSVQGELVDELFDILKQRKFYNDYNPLANDSWQIGNIKEFNKTCDTLGFEDLKIEVTEEFRQLVKEHVALRLKVEQDKLTPEGIALAEERRLKREAQAVKKYANEVSNWRQGGKLTCQVSSIQPQILRIVGDQVETSKGAKVPLIDAQNMLSLIQVGKAKVGDKIGHYTFNTINKDEYGDGMVKIGCHNISIAEAKAVLGALTLKVAG